MKKNRRNVNISNKKAYFEYEILEEEVCGIVLNGNEIKSIIAGLASISEAYCFIDNGEIFVKGMHISEPKHYNEFQEFNPLRVRKLLMTKKQIRKYSELLKNKGITCIPLKLFTNDKGLLKLNIGLAKGKKNYDKRADIRDKDIKRDTDRQINSFFN